MNIQITSRDRDILCDVFEHKMYSQEALKDKYFASTSKQAFHLRVSKLVKNGLLNKEVFHDHRNKIVYYSLNKKGWDLIAFNYTEDKKNLFMRSYAPFHDECLIRIKNIFESTNEVKEYYTEVLLQSFNNENCLDKDYLKLKDINADAGARVLLSDYEFICGIEYERSRKTPKILINKLRSYLDQSKPPMCFFLLDNNSEVEYTLNTLKGIDHKDSKNFLFSTVDKLFSGDLSFKNIRKREVKLTTRKIV